MKNNLVFCFDDDAGYDFLLANPLFKFKDSSWDSVNTQRGRNTTWVFTFEKKDEEKVKEVIKGWLAK